MNKFPARWNNRTDRAIQTKSQLELEINDRHWTAVNQGKNWEKKNYKDVTFFFGAAITSIDRSNERGIGYFNPRKTIHAIDSGKNHCRFEGSHFRSILGKAHQHQQTNTQDSEASNPNHESYSSNNIAIFSQLPNQSNFKPLFHTTSTYSKNKKSMLKINFPKNRLLITFINNDIEDQSTTGRKRGENKAELPDVGGRQRRGRNAGGPASMDQWFANISGSGPGSA